ncbi:PTS cellbiose transporter subunit IIC, partial [Salmonella enterica]|nr:PTS cellbiose transporter subunit IIC [Salmonella enterica]
ATICDARVRDWLLENGFELITFGDLQR